MVTTLEQHRGYLVSTSKKLMTSSASAKQLYSGFASGEREPDGLLLGLCFWGLDASPFAGEALGDLDLAGDLEGERPFDADLEREETDLERDLDAERRALGDLLGLWLLLLL
jgi:hypothetical protein